MDAAVGLANRLTHGGHDAGRHGSAVAAAAPGIGGPVLVFVVDGIGSLRSEKFYQTLHHQLLSFFGRSSGPRHGVVRFDESSEQAGAAFGGSEISGNKFAGWLVALQHAVQSALAPEWFLVSYPILDDRAHRHVLREDGAVRRQYRVIINSHGKRQRNRHDSVVTLPVALVGIHNDPGSILSDSPNRRLQDDSAAKFCRDAQRDLMHGFFHSPRLSGVF